MSLQAVIFDLDGVLADTVEYHYRSWEKVCKEEGLPFSRQVNENLLGLTRRRSLEVILNGRILSEEKMLELLRRKNEYYLDLIESMGPENLLPGVARLLAELQAAGLCVGVASASRNAGPILKQTGADQWMDVIGDASHIQRSKPAPDVYLHVAEQLNVSPGDCLALEDSEAGVQAAKSAGMCVMGLGPPERLVAADFVYPDLSSARLKDLEAAFQEWQTRSVLFRSNC